MRASAWLSGVISRGAPGARITTRPTRSVRAPARRRVRTRRLLTRGWSRGSAAGFSPSARRESGHSLRRGGPAKSVGPRGAIRIAAKSSANNRCPRRWRAAASVDFPQPDAPHRTTALRPIVTALPWRTRYPSWRSRTAATGPRARLRTTPTGTPRADLTSTPPPRRIVKRPTARHSRTISSSAMRATNGGRDSALNDRGPRDGIASLRADVAGDLFHRAMLRDLRFSVRQLRFLGLRGVLVGVHGAFLL